MDFLDSLSTAFPHLPSSSERFKCVTMSVSITSSVTFDDITTGQPEACASTTTTGSPSRREGNDKVSKHSFHSFVSLINDNVLAPVVVINNFYFIYHLDFH